MAPKAEEIKAALAVNVPTDRHLVQLAVNELARAHGHTAAAQVLTALGRAGVRLIDVHRALRLAEREIAVAGIEPMPLPEDRPTSTRRTR